MPKKVLDPELAVASPGFVEEYAVHPTHDADGVQVSSGIGKDGRFEYPDPVPQSPPVGYGAPKDLMQMVKEMVHSELYQSHLAEEGLETEEEAADFDIDDDPLPPVTFHEAILMPVKEPVAAAPAPAPGSVVPPPSTGTAPAEPGVSSPPADNSAPSTSMST